MPSRWENATRRGTLSIHMAGGGTGGHLYPGLAVAEALEKQVTARGVKLEITWLATPRPVDQRLLSKFGDRYIKQPVRPFSPSVLKWAGFWLAWTASCNYLYEDYGKGSVDCVVALGGYAAGPAGHVAAKTDVPLVLLNPDALAGRANRYLAKKADVIVAQWPMAGGNVEVLGCPIRRELFGRSREEGAKRLGIDPGLKTLVVTGASLGAKTINDAMVLAMGDEKSRRPFAGEPPEGGTPNLWQILHLAGLDQAAEVRAAYARYPGLRATVLDYCDDMASVWAVADLAIARAGASTCAELTACGIPSILLPYPFHKDMHQLANARELQKAGAAVIVPDARDAKNNATSIQTALQPLLYDHARRSAMADAARAIGKPAAADAIAAEILALIGASSR